MLPLADNENIVVDPKKYQSIAIFLRALKVTCEDVSKAILDENSNSNELMNIDGEVRKLTNAHAGDFAQFLEPGVENPDRRPLPQCIYGLIFNEETQTSKRIMAIDGEGIVFMLECI